MEAGTDSRANEMRHSPYPMIEMHEAMKSVLLQASPLPSTMVSLDCVRLGSVLAENVCATTDIPQFPTSIVDGYAVGAPCESGLYSVVGRLYTGTNPFDEDHPIQVRPGQCVYITTGSILPMGTNAVLKVESTETDTPASGHMEGNENIMQNESEVKFLDPVNAGQDVRQAKSDMSSGTTILKAGQSLGPAEVGLLAACGAARVRVIRQAKVGVLSTGDELVEPRENPHFWQVRDVNRIMLLSYVKSQGAEAVDLGIIRDVKTSLESAIEAALDKCDILLTSGGVSMGEIDLLKPLLTKLGEVHFGRICMKPGKPTTFATANKGNQKKLILALPGNPVSSLVTAQLFVGVAIKRMHGSSSPNSLPTQVQVKLDSNFEADRKREEYQRATLHWYDKDRCFLAKSTGSQMSSRILSCKSSNALIILPAGSGLHAKGSFATALVVGDLPPPKYGSVFSHQIPPPHAAAEDVSSEPDSDIKEDKSAEKPTFTTQITPAKAGDQPATPLKIKAGVITVSDRAAKGIYKDISGPMINVWLQRMFDAKGILKATLPDEVEQVRDVIKDWADHKNLDIIFLTGGTGFSIRDTTPEAVAPLIEKEAPGIVHALLQAGLSHTPLAALSRPVAGVRGKTLIVTLPGSSNAVGENIEGLRPLLPHIIKQLQGFECGATAGHTADRGTHNR